MFTRLFVQNPIFTNVIAIIAVILGIVSLTRLPIALYPDITPPTIAVSASYPGADAETVAKTVGANRMVQTVSVPYPLGDPELSAEAEWQLRTSRVEAALNALATDIAEPTVVPSKF